MPVRHALLAIPLLAALAGCQLPHAQQASNSTPSETVAESVSPSAAGSSTNARGVAILPSQYALSHGNIDSSTSSPELHAPERFEAVVVTDELPEVSRVVPAAYEQGPIVIPASRYLTSSNRADDAEPLLPSTSAAADVYPINLASAMQLAGANNLQIAMAEERVREAYARLDGAEVLWVPSLNGGFGYNHHDGRLQETEGNVLDAARSSYFAGGGASLASSPLAGGSNGPARFFVDMSPVDIYFEPLAARQVTRAAQASETVTFNDTLLVVVVGYFELVRAESAVAIAEEAVTNAEELVRLTGDFARSGAGLEADAARARAELADRRRVLLMAQEEVRVVSAELVRVLRLDPNVVLSTAEQRPVQVEVVSEELTADDLVAQGLSRRPELAQYQALVCESLRRMQQENWRPWLPNLHLGASGGNFGGGTGGFLGNNSGRADFDALAVWQLRNLGLGNDALQRERRSQYRQANLAYAQVRDRVAADVITAYQKVTLRRSQIDHARQQVEAAAAALPLNFRGIRGRELRAIEAQQAIAALATARERYLAAIIAYNQAQFALLRAIGEPPDSMPADEALSAVMP